MRMRNTYTVYSNKFVHTTKNKTLPEIEKRMEMKIEKKRETVWGLVLACRLRVDEERERERERVSWCFSRDHPSAINGKMTSMVVREEGSEIA